MFQRSTQPDQLLISEGRILALAADEGRQVWYVRIHSLETGQPVRLRYHSTNGEQEIDRILVAGKSEKVMMRVVGSHLYLASPGYLYSYNLDRPEESWSHDPSNALLPLTSVREMTVAKNFPSVRGGGHGRSAGAIGSASGSGQSKRPAGSAAQLAEPGGAAGNDNETTYSIDFLRPARSPRKIHQKAAVWITTSKSPTTPESLPSGRRSKADFAI